MSPLNNRDICGFSLDYKYEPTFVSTEQRSGCLLRFHSVCKIAVFAIWQFASDILSQMVLKRYALENLPSWGLFKK